MRSLNISPHNLNKNPPTWGWVNHYFTSIPLYAGCIITDMFWEFFDADSPENTDVDHVSGESLLQLKVGLLEPSHFSLGHFQLIPDVLWINPTEFGNLVPVSNLVCHLVFTQNNL